MRTWRNALNKVTGTALLSSLKTAASVAAVLFGALIAPANAQAPAAAPNTAPASAPAAVPAAPAPAPAKPAVNAKPFDKPLWNSLTPSQKIALAPIADEWDQADGVRKQKWLEIANRFASMKPDEQARVHERMRDLFKMSPEERRLVRDNYIRAKKIGPTQKSEEWEKYQQLPEEKKKQLADEAVRARAKKQVANLPPASQSNVKTVAPIRRTPPVAGCAPGTVKNTAATAGAAACIPATAAATPAAPVNPSPAAPVLAPAPAPNAK
ncbi:MAG: hypothetical protein JWR40_2919 [Massilia sp.]|nr:hypothetical protein [Massilia sp.]